MLAMPGKRFTRAEQSALVSTLIQNYVGPLTAAQVNPAKQHTVIPGRSMVKPRACDAVRLVG